MESALSAYLTDMDTIATRSGDRRRWWMYAEFSMSLWAAGIQRVEAWQTKLFAAWVCFGTDLLNAASARAFG